VSKNKISSNAPIKNVDANVETLNNAIIGTYEGECADATITNLNGLDITREVWENVFSSDIYKKAIEHGWYIGYLGHPEGDPDCQDFRKACIVMTEGHIDNSGKVFGKFNLIDTPVGRIVKAFQDAGVKFGISVRGAGDIIQNSVDPDTFVFRGFDLVTFPAFPESIPEFTAIAASTDSDKRAKYQAVCAAVKNNIDSLDTVASIDIVQSCFAKQSDEYKVLEDKKQTLLTSEEIPDSAKLTIEDEPSLETTTTYTEGCSEDTVGECIEIDPRVDSMVWLYLEYKNKCSALEAENKELKEYVTSLQSENARRMTSVERICKSQINDLNNVIDSVECSLDLKTTELKDLQLQHRKELRSIQSSVSERDRKIKQLEDKLEFINQSNERKLRKVQASLDAEIQKNSELKEENLKYIKKVESADKSIKDKSAVVASLQAELDETVRKMAQVDKKSSNLDDKISRLNSKIEAAESLTRDYQDAYANLYANALGIGLPDLRVTAETSVDSLQKMIRGSTSIMMKPSILEPTQDVDSSDFDVVDYDDDDLVTL